MEIAAIFVVVILILFALGASLPTGHEIKFWR